MSAPAYRVSAGTQVHVDGETYIGGQDVPADVASKDIAHWLNAGWIEPKPAKTSKSR